MSDDIGLEWVPDSRRIHIMGNSCSGKTTLAQVIAEARRVPHINLDAINWQPGWVGLNATDPDLLETRFRDATEGDAWVVSGSYTRHSQNAFWSRLDTVIWLDMPLPLLVKRMVARSWRRWRSGELLWGTNRESFFGQFALWRKEDSLLWWILTQHKCKRQQMLAFQKDPRWARIHFVTCASVEDVEALTSAYEEATPPAA